MVLIFASNTTYPHETLKGLYCTLILLHYLVFPIWSWLFPIPMETIKSNILTAYIRLERNGTWLRLVMNQYILIHGHGYDMVYRLGLELTRKCADVFPSLLSMRIVEQRHPNNYWWWYQYHPYYDMLQLVVLRRKVILRGGKVFPSGIAKLHRSTYGAVGHDVPCPWTMVTMILTPFLGCGWVMRVTLSKLLTAMFIDWVGYDDTKKGGAIVVGGDITSLSSYYFEYYFFFCNNGIVS